MYTAAGCPGFVAESPCRAVRKKRGSVCAPDSGGGIGGGVECRRALGVWCCLCVGWLGGEAVVEDAGEAGEDLEK